MQVRKIPSPNVPVIDRTTGLITQHWYEFFAGLRLADLTDVSTTAPTNLQVLIYNATTKLWEPGAN